METREGPIDPLDINPSLGHTLKSDEDRIMVGELFIEKSSGS